MHESEYDRLVGLVYDTVDCPAGWRTLFRELEQRLGLDAWMLVRGSPRGIELAVAGGERVSATRNHQYEAHYSRIDPRVPLLLYTRPGEVMSCAAHFDARFVDRSEFFQDFLLPTGLRYMLGGEVGRDQQSRSVVTVLRGPERGCFDPSQEQLMARLMVHMRRALKLQSQLAVERGRVAIAGRALDALGCAAFGLDADGRVLSRDGAADLMLAAGSPVRLAAGRLACVVAADQLRFSTALLACRDECRPVMLTISCLREPPQRYSLSLLPSGSAVRGGTEAAPGGFTCLVTRLDEAPLADPRHVAIALGLTPAEARLAWALAAGHTLETHAAASGVRLTTVRSQLRDIFAKTGMTKQSALVRLVAALPPLD